MLTDTHTMALKFDFSPKDKEIKKKLVALVVLHPRHTRGLGSHLSPWYGPANVKPPQPLYWNMRKITFQKSPCEQRWLQSV